MMELDVQAWVNVAAYTGAGIAMGLGAVGAAIGEGYTAAQANLSVSRNPQLSGDIFKNSEFIFFHQLFEHFRGNVSFSLIGISRNRFHQGIGQDDDEKEGQDINEDALEDGKYHGPVPGPIPDEPVSRSTCR